MFPLCEHGERRSPHVRPTPQAASEFYTFYEAMAMLQECKEASVRWYALEESARPIGVFEAHTVPILPLATSRSATTIWPPPQRAAPNFPPRRRRQDAAPEEEVAGDDDGAPWDELHEQEAEVFAEAEVEEDIFGDFDQMLADLMEPIPVDVAAMAEEPRLVDAPGAVAQVDAAEDPSAEVPAEPAAEVRRGAGARQRSSATVTMHVPGGSISYYPSKAAFEAVCDNPRHGRCVVTRTSRTGGGVRRQAAAGGRPVGFLAAWLGAGQDLPDKDAHWSMACFDQSHEQRTALRSQIAGTPSGRTLLASEREVAVGEDPEPVDLRPYLPSR